MREDGDQNPPQPIEYASPGVGGVEPTEPNSGEKLFVIFILVLVPLIAFGVLASTLYSLLAT